MPFSIRMGHGTIGVDPYNLAETGEVVSTVTTYVGQATGSGPKVVVRKQESIQTVGTIDASIYSKNSHQDNSKLIITRKTRTKEMENQKPRELLKKAIEEGKDVLGVITLAESLLKIVAEGEMTSDEVLAALDDIRSSLEDNARVKTNGYGSMAEAIKDINADAPHQQDQLNCQDEAARTLAASTHGAASHLTKTVIEGEDEEGEEVCIVRRLTPTETARLQGFPDDYTKIDGPDTADAPQFKSHGNSWATPCANMINTRVDMELRRLGHKGTIRYATCCSGIEAHSVSVRNLDWKSMFFSEVEPFPCRVLAAHYPQTPNLGDMTQIHFDAAKGVITNAHKDGEEYSLPKEFLEAPIQDIPFKIGEMEVFSGGTPCQSVSIAGKREGMAENSGTRSSLAFHYQRIIDESRPMFTIWENVPGAFSSNGGADFIWFVNRCAESGYAMAWRVLDAQYVMTEDFPRAVPQRRRRIWLIGYRGNDWRIPARIVFELEKNLTANPPTRVPGLGFKELSDEGRMMIESSSVAEEVPTDNDNNLFGLMFDSNTNKLIKVSQMIDFSEMPNEPDFSKVSMADIYSFAKKIGEPGYIGSVFRTDKKKSKANIKKFATYDLFSMLDEGSDKEILSDVEIGEETEWEGAEKITPAILENIGNSGILANGRICTLNCHEWTSGIQLSPETYKAWKSFVNEKEWYKANALLPEAYDETVCGLSDVLQEDPDEKYNLSWRACFGILRRAEARGKELPTALEIALVSTIRENAGIVKWIALNGKDTKKKETDMTERECAMVCFQKFIAPVVKFEDIVPIPPKRKNGEDNEEDEEDGNIVLDSEDSLEEEDDEGFGEMPTPSVGVPKDKIPTMPNGVMNESGGETAPTIVASQYKGPGNMQDATVVAVKK